MKQFIFFAFALLILNSSSFVSAQTNSVSLISYYPAPIGAYDRLRLIPHDKLTGHCDNGSLYFSAYDKNLELCKNNLWVSATGIWSTLPHPADEDFDTWTPGVTVDQFYFSTPYPDLTKRKPWVGIGTNNPKAPLHIVINSTGTPSVIKIDNNSTTHGSEGPGECLSFHGDLHEEYVALRAIYNDLNAATAESHLSLFLRDGTGEKERKFVFGKPGFLGLNYVWTSDMPNAVLSILGNAAATSNTLDYLMISTNNTASNNGNVLTVDFNGNVGINKKIPTEKFEVSGKIKATTLILTSDATSKKDIIPISRALEKISHLNGISFKWENNTHYTDQRRHMGVTAQDTAKIFPEIVYGKDGAKGVNYPSLIAPLIEAVKELKERNVILKQQFQEQSAHIHNQQQKIKYLENSFKNQRPILKRGHP